MSYKTGSEFLSAIQFLFVCHIDEKLWIDFFKDREGIYLAKETSNSD